MEAENFTASAGSQAGWVPKPWMLSNNRFAASVADTYLSRRAYLRGDADMEDGLTATMEFEIEQDEAGDYLGCGAVACTSAGDDAYAQNCAVM